MLLHGLCPAPIDPCVVQLLVYGFNPHSLHQAFVSEWHPALGQLLRDWNTAGFAGDLAPFQAHLASYMGLEDVS